MNRPLSPKPASHRRIHLLLALSAWLLVACSTPLPPETRQRQATELAHSHGWQSLQLNAGIFRLQAFAPTHFAKGERLTLYLEGDGFAWISARQPSNDPTPLNPQALHLALAQPAGNAAYLGRPCQYLGANRKPCRQRYWTGARFSEEVVASLDLAADQLKALADARQLTLVGYSGGAALALLLAARRDDVDEVFSVAGNLDHRAWTERLHLTPLADSLNPAHMRAQLVDVRQRHWVGADDRIVPPQLADHFVAGFSGQGNIRVQRLPGVNHHCCWTELWPQLWQRSRQD